MKRDLLALGVTASIVFSLVAFAQPSAAVLATVSGPDQVDKPDRMTFTTAIEIREDERIPVEGIDLVIATADGETATISFAPNGTVAAIDPAEGVVGQGEIKIDQLRERTEITALESGAEYGYGYRSAEDERTGETRSFGYGYGYGAGEFAYEIELDSRAFKHGEYELHVSVDAGGATFTSDATTFEVGPGGGSGPGERGPDRGNGRERGNGRN